MEAIKCNFKNRINIMSNEQSEVTQAKAIDTQKIIDELALNSCSLNSNARAIA